MNYQRAFDSVKHDKLLEIMKRAGIPEFHGEKSNHKLVLATECGSEMGWEYQPDVKVEKGVT